MHNFLDNAEYKTRYQLGAEMNIVLKGERESFFDNLNSEERSER